MKTWAMKVFSVLALAVAMAVTMGTVAAEPKSANHNTNGSMNKIPDGAEFIILGAGCFWCTEAVISKFQGCYL
jgi:hypothetical protein